MTQEITNRNVYILGAGFSANAGAPLVSNFLDVARELYDDPLSDLDREERQLFQKVFDFKAQMSRAREKMRIDLDNIEDLFGLVEMAHRLGESEPAVRDSTVYLIAKTLQLAIGKSQHRGRIAWQLDAEKGNDSSFPTNIERDETNKRYFADLYDFFAALISGCYDDQSRQKYRDSCVISFNYDLILDDALWRIGSAPQYHLENAHYDQSPARGVSVLKLHGSTNWAVCQNCQHVLVAQPKMTASHLEFISRQCPNCRDHRNQLLLVPPSWDKSEFQGLMRSVWKKAAEALWTATRICVIGYSMPEADAFFRYLLTLGLASNHQLYKMIVVNLDAQSGFTGPLDLDLSDAPRCAFGDLLTSQHPARSTTIEERYRELFESTFAKRRFSYCGQGFGFYIGNGHWFRELGRGELIRNIQMF